MKNIKFLFMTLIAIASVFSTAFAAATGNIAPLITTAISGVAFNAIYTPFTGLSFIAFAPLIASQNFREFFAAVRNMGLPEGVIASPAEIISENTITAGKTLYSFPVKQQSLAGTITNFPLQLGVKDNDLFIAWRIGVLLSNRASTSDSNVKYQTYVSNAVFGANTADVNDLQSFYNGVLQLKTGSTVFVDQFSTQNFLKVPQTQKTGSTNENEYSLDYALTDIGGRPIFSGKADQDVQVSVTGSSSFDPSGSGGTVNVITFLAKGVLLKNGANQQGLYEQLVKASIKGA